MNETVQAPQMAPSQITVQQVVQALMQGITPQELIEAGVPQAMVEQAMQVIMQQQESEQNGLAGALVAGDNAAQPTQVGM